MCQSSPNASLMHLHEGLLIVPSLLVQVLLVSAGSARQVILYQCKEFRMPPYEQGRRLLHKPKALSPEPLKSKPLDRLNRLGP